MASTSFFLSIRLVCSSWLITRANSLLMTVPHFVGVEKLNFHDQFRGLDRGERDPKSPFLPDFHFHFSVYRLSQPSLEADLALQGFHQHEAGQPAFESFAIPQISEGTIQPRRGNLQKVGRLDQIQLIQLLFHIPTDRRAFFHGHKPMGLVDHQGQNQLFPLRACFKFEKLHEIIFNDLLGKVPNLGIPWVAFQPHFTTPYTVQTKGPPAPIMENSVTLSSLLGLRPTSQINEGTNNKRPFGRLKSDNPCLTLRPKNRKKKAGRKGPTFWENLKLRHFYTRKTRVWQGQAP